MNVAVMGSTGYIGRVLLRLLANHPEIDQIFPVSGSSAGTPLAKLDPGLAPQAKDKFTSCDSQYISVDAVPSCDVVFAALPHLKSAEMLEPFFGKAVVIDLSADFRIKDSALFQKAYGVTPPRPDLLSSAVYGLCEWYKKDIKSADLIANPGCYPTTSLLPLLPLAKAGLIQGDIIVNAMSGISGAGKKAKENLMYTSRTENAAAYLPGQSHRHYSEIASQLQAFSAGGNGNTELYFTPHLVPIHHGMQVTTSILLKKDVGDIHQLYTESYASSPFVLIRDEIPETSQVRGTNRCDIHIHREGRRLFLISVSDNLYKGASGQAVQNMNIRFGFAEDAGLRLHGEI